MIPVDLNITTLVKTDEGEDKIELFTAGKCDFRNGNCILSYDEGGGIGYEHCRVKITVSEKSVTIERTGPAAATFSVEKNVKHHSVYGTPFGDFTMGINTYDIKNTLTRSGGRLWFKYSIDINSDFVSENEMEIIVSMPGNSVAQNAMSP